LRRRYNARRVRYGGVVFIEIYEGQPFFGRRIGARLVALHIESIQFL